MESESREQAHDRRPEQAGALPVPVGRQHQPEEQGHDDARVRQPEDVELEPARHREGRQHRNRHRAPQETAPDQVSERILERSEKADGAERGGNATDGERHGQEIEPDGAEVRDPADHRTDRRIRLARSDQVGVEQVAPGVDCRCDLARHHPHRQCKQQGGAQDDPIEEVKVGDRGASPRGMLDR